jgi:hypothetical protein
MKVSLLRRCVVVAMIVLCAVAGAASNTRRQAAGTCSKETNYETLRYTIRNIRIDDPWRFLRLSTGTDEAEKAAQSLKGKPYNTGQVDTVFKIVESKRLLDSELSYSAIELENCADNQLDVVYKMFSVRISPLFSSTFEFRQKEKNDPAEASGVADKTNVKFVPEAGYDATNKLFGGGTGEVKWRGRGIPFDALSLTGLGGSTLRRGSATLTGHHESATKLVSSAEWRLDYEYSSLPTDSAQLKNGRVAFQAMGMTRPLKGVVFRFGAQGEGGNQQSNFSQSALSSRTLSSSGYSSLKVYGGLTLHPRNQAIAASYGLELGSTGSSLHGDWRKHVADVAHEFWVPVGDHRMFEVEQRLTAGTAQILRSIPVKALFFGGNREEPFVPGQTWSIRANPVIRSIPSNRFYRTRDGAGAERFISYNSTVAVTVWRKPLVPRELIENPDFTQKLNGALVSSTSILQVTYASEDGHFRDALKLVPPLGERMQELQELVAALPSADECTDAIDSAMILVTNIKKQKPARAYGSVKELLPGGDDSIENLVAICKTGTEAPVVIAKADAVGALAGQMQSSFTLIDQARATARAEQDMVYVRRTLDIVLHDLNIASISPLFIFDVAQIGPKANGPYSGTRYGIGGGIRFSLVNMVHFSGGYAVNPSRQPGEPPGAVFFKLSTRSLFR